jgi:hypothetical protein
MHLYRADTAGPRYYLDLLGASDRLLEGQGCRLWSEPANRISDQCGDGLGVTEPASHPEEVSCGQEL